MKEYLAPRLANAAAFLISAHSEFTMLEDAEFTAEVRESVRANAERFVREAHFLGLPMTLRAGQRFLQATKTQSAAQLEGAYTEVHSRFQDEAATLPLFYVHQDALRYYNKTDLFGEQFKAAFPSANSEIIEAGNCFAFDRFTASVFHLSRALEIVLRVLFVDLGMPPRIWSTTKWSKILERIDGKIRKNNITFANDPGWQDCKGFYENTYAFLAAVRAPMRNATMHVGAPYDEAGAENVFGAVKSFMRHAATRLKE